MTLFVFSLMIAVKGSAMTAARRFRNAKEPRRTLAVGKAIKGFMIVLLLQALPIQQD